MIHTKFVLFKNLTFHYDPEEQNSHLKFNNCNYFLALRNNTKLSLVLALQE